MTLLYIVEDNPDLLSDALIWLNDDEFESYGAGDALELERLLEQQSPDLIVLDWMLPGEDGLSIANRLRDSIKNEQTGIVFMTARRDIEDRLSGLDVADAYMTKPVDYRELKAVIRSVVRRLTPSPQEPCDMWVLNRTMLTVQSPAKEFIDMTAREIVVLELLIENQDRIVAIDEIKMRLEQQYPIIEKTTLERLISRLRSKIKNISMDKENPIRSYRFTGYRLILPIIID